MAGKANHGHSRSNNGKPTPEYEAWAAMHRRCRARSHPEFKNYGGRGIRVCEEWTGHGGFEPFLAHVGGRPSTGHSLDRIDVNGNYEPGNVRWADRETQNANKRTNRYVVFNGETLTVAQLARRVGASKDVVLGRLARGLPIEEVARESKRYASLVEVDGEAVTYTEAARRLGLSVGPRLGARSRHAEGPLRRRWRLGGSLMRTPLEAVTYVLQRVRTDPDFYHHMAFTESLVALVEAYVALGGPVDPTVTVEHIVERLNSEPPPGRPRCVRAEDE